MSVQLGQTVYLGRRIRGQKEKELIKTTVIKIKRLYYTVDYGNLQFRIDDNVSKNRDFLIEFTVYLSKQDYVDEKEKNKLESEMHIYFGQDR
jgi:hypothetical protein